MNQVLNKSTESLSETSLKTPLKLVKNAKASKNTSISLNGTDQESSLRLYDDNNKRYFDFNPIASLGHRFAIPVAETFIFYSSGVASCTAESAFSAVSRFFRWLIANESRHPKLISTLLKDHEKCAAIDWEDAISDWQEEIKSDSGIGSVRKHNLMSAIRTFFKRLAARGVVPKMFFPRLPTELRNAGRPTKCLAEALQIDKTKKHEREVNKYLSKTKSSGVHLEIKRDFLTVLLQEKGTIAGVEHEHAKELMKVNAERLALIRECAVKDFQKWHSHWLEGQALLKKCDLSFDEMQAAIESWNFGNERNEESIFPEGDPEIALARLLNYVQQHPTYKGQILRMNFTKRDLILRNQVPRFGGTDALQAYLFPHSNLAVAAILIFLCDTGANVSVGWSLSLNCLEDANEPGYKSITGIKMRAGGKLIVNQLPVKDRRNELSCVQALETYREISSSLRQLASPETAENLFLYIGWSATVQNASNLWWTKSFKYFVKRHPEISHLKLNSKMIRPSVLMQATYAENSGIAAAGVLADHKSLKTTDSYVAARYPLQIIWERMIREFQTLFQVIAVHPIDGAAEKLGLSAEQMATLLREAHRTGLGVACLDPLAGVQPNTSKNESCGELQNCPNCPQRFVVASVENLKDLILWNHHLKAQRDEWEKQRPERWEKVWLPWLAFTEVAIEAASRGRTLIEYTKANSIAKTLIENDALNFPPLW